MIDAILVYSPEKELQVLTALARIGDKLDWKPAIILSATYLEKFGFEKLQRFFKQNKMKQDKKLEDLRLHGVANCLLKYELINQESFDVIDKIRKERNAIVHQKKRLPVYVGSQANEKYELMIRKAIKIIEDLKEE